MDYESIGSIAREVRRKFERKEIPPEELEQLYFDYNSIKDIKTFIRRALESFPRGNCGLASVYLQRLFPEAEVVRGRYEEQPHTFLVLRENTVIDITADQFGGPEVYVGPLCGLWKKD